MVNEIKNCFESVLKSLKDARALRDELAKQARNSPFSTSWHTSNMSSMNFNVRNLQKIDGTPFIK
ncbi:MAG: hypothetical protein WKF92_15610 [Pyrinomonadaceae bacterium]